MSDTLSTANASDMIARQTRQKIQAVHLFRLPSELRFKIYEMALEEEGKEYFVECQINGDMYLPRGTFRPPALAHVCKEAREIASQAYRVCEVDVDVFLTAGPEHFGRFPDKIPNYQEVFIEQKMLSIWYNDKTDSLTFKSNWKQELRDFFRGLSAEHALIRNDHEEFVKDTLGPGWMEMSPRGFLGMPHSTTAHLTRVMLSESRFCLTLCGGTFTGT
jgi:hypothetical protein